MFRRRYPEVPSMLFVFWLTLISVVFVFTSWQIVIAEQSSYKVVSALSQQRLTNTIKAIRPPSLPMPPPPLAAKGIYITSYSASSNRFDELIDLVKETELNAVVIDIKNDSGSVAYNTDVPIINDLETENVRIKDLPALLKRLDELGIYKIARMAVFQDPALVSARPDLAVRNKTTGGLWYDWKGLTWLDPHNQEVWDYNVALARDAISKGFDEINLDYIRFPSDGPISEISYPHANGLSKVQSLNSFFEYFDKALEYEPAYLSADLFGMTLWSDSDFNIGQTLKGAAPYFDYICPMVYPSHYPSGFDGFANPAANPYEIVFRNLKKGGAVLTEGDALLRPWLQDFHLGATYTPEMVRAQIRAAEENETFGWLLWNASNRYTQSALELK